jgi:hypothetical protein
MKSSDLSGAFHSVAAVYLPLSFLSAFIPFGISLVRSLAASFPPFFYGALLIPGGLTALAASFYYSLMKSSKADHTAAAIRGGIIVIAAAYPLASVLRFGEALALRFLPAFPNIFAPLCALYVWVQVISLKHLFEAREVLEAYTEKYQGEKLQQLMLEDADLLSSLNLRIVKTRRIVFVQIGFIYALGLVRAILKNPLAPPEFALLVMVFLNGACFSGLLGLFQQEHYHAGEGIAAESRDRARRIGEIVLFSLAAVLGALLLAPGRSILPFSLITGLLAWIAALLARLPRPDPRDLPPPEMPARIAPPAGRPQAFFMEGLEPTEPWPFWEWLQYGAVALGAFLFIRFMLKPLFNRSRIGGPLRERLRRLAAQWFRDLRAALALFIAALRGEGIRSAALNPEALRRAAGDLLAAYSSRKRRELRASLTLFARLIVWGSERLGVSWKPSLGPGEYCALLRGALLYSAPPGEAARTGPEAASGEPAPEGTGEPPAFDRAGAVVRCGELFEQALYAPEPLSEAENREFKRLVGELTG